MFDSAVFATATAAACADRLEARHAARVERYALKSVVDALHPASTTARCGKQVAPGSQIQIWRSLAYGASFIVGLLQCASVWSCPLCSSKISERRRIDLDDAVRRWRDRGGGVYLLTATVPHGQGDDLKQILRAMLGAWRLMVEARQYKRLRVRFGVVGTVRAVEVTYGALNGWHPHIHALIFLDSVRWDTWTLRAEYYALWQGVCRRVGFPVPSFEHGLRVDNGDSAAAYVVGHGSGHWGLAGEVTKGHIKRSRRHYSPWDLLRYAVNSAAPRDGVTEARRLFSVYASAFHGCRQLHFSVGLKNRLSISQHTDTDLAYSREDSALLLFDIDIDDWRYVSTNLNLPDLLRISETRPEKIKSFIQLCKR